MDTWTDEVTSIADPEKFDWVEIKPIVNEPEKFIKYVPRCKTPLTTL